MEEQQHAAISATPQLSDAMDLESLRLALPESPPLLPPLQKRGRGSRKPARRKAKAVNWISFNKPRAVTFSKRKTGLFNKGLQLLRLTHCNVFLFIQQVSTQEHAVFAKEQQSVGDGVAPTTTAESVGNVASVEDKDAVAAATDSVLPATATAAVNALPRSVNHYTYACDAWRPFIGSPEVQQLAEAAFAATAAAIIEPNAIPTPIPTPTTTTTEPVRFKMTELIDSHPGSDARDLYHSVFLDWLMPSQPPSSKSKQLATPPSSQDESSTKTESSVSDEDDNEEEKDDGGDGGDDGEEEEEETKAMDGPNAVAPTKATAPRKPGPLIFDFIHDRKKRGTSFCKRKLGIMKKAFELTHMTRCRCLVVLGYPSSLRDDGVSEMYHIYCSPVWRPLVLNKTFIGALFRAQQLGNASPAPRAIQADQFDSMLPPLHYGYGFPAGTLSRYVKIMPSTGHNASCLPDQYYSFAWRMPNVPRPPKPPRIYVRKRPLVSRITTTTATTDGATTTGENLHVRSKQPRKPRSNNSRKRCKPTPPPEETELAATEQLQAVLFPISSAVVAPYAQHFTHEFQSYPAVAILKRYFQKNSNSSKTLGNIAGLLAQLRATPVV